MLSCHAHNPMLEILQTVLEISQKRVQLKTVPKWKLFQQIIMGVCSYKDTQIMWLYMFWIVVGKYG